MGKKIFFNQVILIFEERRTRIFSGERNMQDLLINIVFKKFLISLDAIKVPTQVPLVETINNYISPSIVQCLQNKDIPVPFDILFFLGWSGRKIMNLVTSR